MGVWFECRVHCDNGSEFINICLSVVVQLFRANGKHGRPYQPWVQGKVERENRTLNGALSKTYLEAKANGPKGVNPSWVHLLPAVTAERNNSPRRWLKNLTPFEVFRGMIKNTLVSPVQQAESMMQLLGKINQQKEVEHLKITARSLADSNSFKIGDIVRVADPTPCRGSKLERFAHAWRFRGKFVLVEKASVKVQWLAPDVPGDPPGRKNSEGKTPAIGEESSRISMAHITMSRPYKTGFTAVEDNEDIDMHFTQTTKEADKDDKVSEDKGHAGEDTNVFDLASATGGIVPGNILAVSDGGAFVLEEDGTLVWVASEAEFAETLHVPNWKCYDPQTIVRAKHVIQIWHQQDLPTYQSYFNQDCSCAIDTVLEVSIHATQHV